MSHENGHLNRLDVLIGLVAVAASIGVIWLLREAYFVFMPIAFGIFVAILVYPMQRWLYNKMPGKMKWASYMITMLTIVVLLGGLLGAIWLSFQSAMGEAPKYAEQARDKWQETVDWAQQYGISLGEASIEPTDGQGNSLPQGTANNPDGSSEEVELGGQLTEGLQGYAVDWLGTILSSAWAFFGFLGITFFLVLLCLIDARTWNRKICDAFPGDNADRVADAVGRIAQKVREFMWVRTITSTLTAVLILSWLLIMGVDFAVLWSIINFTMSYIPNVGAFIAGIPPSIVALLQFGFGRAVVTVIGIMAIENAVGSFLDPRMQGKSLNISPFVLLASLLFWTWMWGAGGALLSVPMTVTFVVACEEIPGLRPIARLLAGETEGEGSKKSESGKYGEEQQCKD